MNNIKNYVKEALDKEFEGSSSAYTRYSVLGATKEEVENVLVKAIEKKYIEEDVAIVSCPNKEGNAFSFCIWGHNPGLAQVFSNFLSDKLWVAETNWDYTIVELYYNGHIMVPEYSYYEMELTYVQNEDCEEDNELCYDTDYIIKDKNENYLKSGIGMISVSDLENLKEISTSVIEGEKNNEYEK